MVSLFDKISRSFSVSDFHTVLYVIILSAALDLVPPSVPKGVILFCNIAPGLVAKVSWPYILKGRIRYAKRLTGCCVLSSLGMLVSSLLKLFLLFCDRVPPVNIFDFICLYLQSSC